MKNWYVFTLLFSILAMVGDDALKEKRIVVLMVGSNARRYIKEALRSVYEQRYANYQLLYIDAASSDESLEFVHEYTARMGKTANLLACIHGGADKQIPLSSYMEARSFLKDSDIVMVLSAQDCLAHQEVFCYINNLYASGDVWMTYGPQRLKQSNKLIYDEKIPEIVHELSAYRNYLFIPHYIHTCYGTLLRKIRRNDFYAGEKFLDTGDQLTCMLPMLQMANGHIRFVPDVLVIRNDALDHTRYAVNPEKQDEVNIDIRNHVSYDKLPRCGVE